MTTQQVGDLDFTYNSGTQPHPTLTFNQFLGIDSGYYAKFSADEESPLQFPDTYFGDPIGGFFSFSLQADAGSLNSGRHFWVGEITVHDATTNAEVGDPEHLFAFQDVINRDASEFGSGWQLTELDRLVLNQTLEFDEYDYGVDEEGVSLITGDNHAVWFKLDAVQSDPDYTTYTRENGNPYSFATLYTSNG